MVSRRLTILFLFLLSAVVAGGARAAAPSAGAPDTLTIMEPGAPDTLDPLLTRTPAGADATAPVFETLVRRDDAGGFQPDLALRWTRSVDARTWTFYLDPRARWQDGEPVAASDVAFTARLVRDARFGAVSTRGFDDISAIAVEGTDIVTVTLNAAYAPFLATFGTTAILPYHLLGGIDPAQIRVDAAFNRHPIGDGPYAVAAFTSGGSVIEEANPDYAGGAPRVTRLVFSPAPSRSGALSAARDGTTLLPPDLDLIPAEAASFGSGAAAHVLYTPSFAWTHLDLIEHGPLASILVRRALALATPRDRIIAEVLRGHGEIADGDQAPGTTAYEPALHNSYHYDPRAARRLLAQAGLIETKDGMWATRATSVTATMPLTVNLWGDSSCAVCGATLGLVAQGWRAAGVATRIRLVPTAFLFGPHGPLYSPGRFQSTEYDAVLYAWVNGPDPDDWDYWSRQSLVTPAHLLGGNFEGYGNAAFDALATEALVTPDGPGRDALYRRIQHILTADEPDVFLYWADNISIVPARLKGYDPTPYEAAATWNAGRWSL